MCACVYYVCMKDSLPVVPMREIVLPLVFMLM